MLRSSLWLIFCAASLLFPTLAKADRRESALPSQILVQGDEYLLSARVFASKDAGKSPVLLVVLHGDAPRNNPGYQYAFAAKAARIGDVIAVGLLRPGYTDPQGNTSQGERGQATGDNYNARNTDSIAAAIGDLKRRYHSRKLVVAAHSGGAAITANMLGRHPGLVDAALLVSCPCDVKAWRDNMFRLTQYSAFQGELNTLSAIDQVNHLSPQVSVTMVVGKQDLVTPPFLSEHYQAAALKAGKKVQLFQLDGKGHEIFLDPEVYDLILPMLK